MRIELFVILTLQIFISQGSASVRNTSYVCKTRDGTLGECVHSYLCDHDTNTIIKDGLNLLDTRILSNEITCPLPMVCCKVAGNDILQEKLTSNTNGDQKTRLVIENFPSPISCTTSDGKIGECEPNHLCDLRTYTVVDDGSNILDPRERSDGCPNSMVCCQVSEQADDTPRGKPNFYTFVRMARELNVQGCGWRNEKGVEVETPIDLKEEHANPGEFPWLVGIMSQKSVEPGEIAQLKYLGGGSLIHPQTVITVAHIFEDVTSEDILHVAVGDFVQGVNSVLPRKIKRVQKVEIHEGYKKDELINDFAIVFLAAPVTVALHVNFICLPPKSVEMASGSKCISSGWGKNGLNQHQYIVNKVELPLVDRQPCQTQLRPLEYMGPFYELSDSFMCAQGEAGMDSCKGSGGSPLICPIEGQPGRYVLAGMAAFSTNCSFDGYPSLYARIASARQWIDDKMAEQKFPITSYTDY